MHKNRQMENKKPLKWKLPFLLFLILGTAYILQNSHQDAPFQKSTGPIFGTIYHATYQYDKDLTNEILLELRKVDNSLSTFNEHSIISQINQNKEVKTDSLFLEVYTRAQEISKATRGAFDITVAPLVNAWGFGFKHSDNIRKEQIDSIRSFVGYQNITLKNGRIIKKDPRIQLDCSAIAKGFGSDCIARMFEQRGIQNYMIEIGGEIVVKGKNPKGSNWGIGVNKPVNDSLNINNEIETVLDISNIAMATSGNYRNFYLKEGKKYAHTIDPETGYPVQHSILSSTVLANDCATADAYATAFMVMGLEKAQALLSIHPELQAYFIYADEKGKAETWFSPKLENMIRK